MDETTPKQQMSQQATDVSKALPDASYIFKLAWDRYKKDGKKYMLILLPIFAVAIIFGWLSKDQAESGYLSAVILTISVVVGVVGIIAEAGLVYCIINKDANLSIGEAYKKGVFLFWPFLLVEILTGIIVSLGFIALVLPGIYLAVRYAFVAFEVVGENKRGMEALNASRDLVQGRWWEVFLRLIFIFILSIIPFSIFFFVNPATIGGQILQNAISLVLAPLWVLYIYVLYQSLKSSAPATV